MGERPQPVGVTRNRSIIATPIPAVRQTHVDPAELRELFEQAVDLPSSERVGFLAQVGGRNADLGQELERLLAADALQGSMFDTRQADADPALGTVSYGRAILPDTLLGPYQIVSILGTGGMGEVYRARDTRLGRTVAIKVLPLELTRNPTARQRLEREARAVAALSHPNICPLFDIGHQDGVDFLVLEYWRARRSPRGWLAATCRWRRP